MEFIKAMQKRYLIWYPGVKGITLLPEKVVTKLHASFINNINEIWWLFSTSLLVILIQIAEGIVELLKIIVCMTTCILPYIL